MTAIMSWWWTTRSCLRSVLEAVVLRPRYSYSAPKMSRKAQFKLWPQLRVLRAKKQEPLCTFSQPHFGWIIDGMQRNPRLILTYLNISFSSCSFLSCSFLPFFVTWSFVSPGCGLLFFISRKGAHVNVIIVTKQKRVVSITGAPCDEAEESTNMWRLSRVPNSTRYLRTSKSRVGIDS
jgi:hypothetical protein